MQGHADSSPRTCAKCGEGKMRREQVVDMIAPNHVVVYCVCEHCSDMCFPPAGARCHPGSCGGYVREA